VIVEVDVNCGKFNRFDGDVLMPPIRENYLKIFFHINGEIFSRAVDWWIF
jgi:hypothetical protein